MSFCFVASSVAAPENVDKLGEIFRKKTVPALSKMEGLKAAYFMTKPSGEVLIFHVWETERQFREWTKCTEHDVIEAEAAKLRTAGFTIDSYEVRIHEDIERF